MKKVLKICLRIVVYLVLMALTVVTTIAVYNQRLLNQLYKDLATDWNDSVGTVLRDQHYAPGDQHTYDLYLPGQVLGDKVIGDNGCQDGGLTNKPLSPNTHQPSPSEALILFIHGGGFTGGDKKDEAVWCKFFTSKGYVTASVNYSLYDGKHNATANLNDMFHELRQCVAAIKKQCAQQGYHLRSMATSGQSAGGCLAMLYAYRETELSPVPVKLVFQQTGPADFQPSGWGNSDDKTAALSVTIMTGKTVTSDMMASGKYHELVAQISPAALVDSTTVPTICAYGPHDKVVPVKLKLKLFRQFKTYGVPYVFIDYPHSGHGLLSDPDRQREFISTSLEWCRKYL